MAIRSKMKKAVSAVKERVLEASPATAHDQPEYAATPAPAATVTVRDPDASVPHVVKTAAGWSWRMLLIAALVWLVWWLVSSLSEVTIPIFVALLFAAALWPLKGFLIRHHLPRGLAVVACLLLITLVVLGVLSLVGAQIATQWTELSEQAVNSFNQLLTWLASSPLHITDTRIDGWLQAAREWVSNSGEKLTSYAASIGVSVGHFFAGAALTLFACVYFLLEGPQLARAVSVVIPREVRPRIMSAAGRGWTAMVAYVRAAVIVAAVDGLGALIGAAAVGSSMWLAIGALTFLCAFIPLVGAIASGIVATAVVLVTLGWVKAVILLAVFIAVLQLEAHVLQPFLLGKAVSIHPLAVLYGIAIGTIIGGIVGALFTVPILAFGNAFLRAMTTSAPTAVTVEVPPETTEVEVEVEPV